MIGPRLDFLAWMAGHQGAIPLVADNQVPGPLLKSTSEPCQLAFQFARRHCPIVLRCEYGRTTALGLRGRVNVFGHTAKMGRTLPGKPRTGSKSTGIEAWPALRPAGKLKRAPPFFTKFRGPKAHPNRHRQ